MGNSVIYIPAYDAEVEYLESDGNSYIDTGLKASSELGILAHIQVLGSAQWLFGGANGYGNKAFSFVIYSDSAASYRYGNGVIELSGFSLNTTYEFDNTQNHNVMKVGSLTYTATATTFTSDYNFYLFTENRNGTPNTASSGARIYDFKIYQNSTLVRNFIPVRIGSVGYMYDKVTKQLFANKGTGNFILGNDVSNAVIPQQRCVLYFGNQRSVGFERIYEEYEWLKGDGKTYISHPNTDEFEVKINIKGTNDAYYEKGIYRANTDYFCGLYTADYSGIGLFSSLRIAGIISNGAIAVYRTNSIKFGEHIINKTAISDAIGVFTDGVRHFKNSGGDTNYVGTDLIFYQLRPNPSCDVGYMTCSQFSFTPCKLLQPIPAILDGNGIARQAGECGMWDKVSNKFYGNVANSGTFTVKNPKCYEEYKWLNCYTAYGATLPAQGADIGITPISLTNKVLTIELGQVSRNVAIYGNSPYFIPIWCSRWQAYNEDYMTLQERKGNNNTLNEITCLWTTSNTITLDFINNVATLGNSTFQIEGTGYTFRGFNNAMWQNPRTVGRIKISDELDLVPCKLTHGIPASMDANGIARPAGTCGMWDKVNDKFYGNVASSGTFTVADD